MNTTTHKTNIIPTENDSIEILIGYDEVLGMQPDVIEECHGIHRVPQSTLDIKLTSVELVIGGVGISLLDKMNDQTKEFIINLL